MIRAAALLLLLAGCSAPVVEGYGLTGVPTSTVLVMAPLCLVICPITVATTGVDTDTIGEGAAGGSQSVSQSASTGVNN